MIVYSIEDTQGGVLSPVILYELIMTDTKPRSKKGLATSS